jgi:NADPH-dependent 2,4-dienoyl-CoA reductase/sulfur reductase-like enzyme
MAESVRFDVVVIGAGPAGLAASLEASAGTSSVAVIDQNPHPGGQIWRPDVSGDHHASSDPLLSRAQRASFINSATVVDAWSVNGRHWLVVEQGGHSMTFETGTVILATGARELFLPFPGWTLPGVVGVGGLQALMKSGLDVRGKRVVVAGTGPLVIAVAATAVRKGAEVAAVVEQAPVTSMLQFAMRAAGKPAVAREGMNYLRQLPAGSVRLGSWVSAANGRGRLSSVRIRSRDDDATVDCDYLGCAYGLVPNLEVARLLGCEIGSNGIVVDDSQRTSVGGVYAAGECTGVGGVNKSMAEGLLAGRAAVGPVSPGRIQRWRDKERRWGNVLNRTFAIRREVLEVATPETIVCRCEDIRMGAIDPNWSVRQAKLYSRAGMGACQGRVCGTALRQLYGWEMDSTRVPLHPAALSSLLGVR